MMMVMMLLRIAVLLAIALALLVITVFIGLGAAEHTCTSMRSRRGGKDRLRMLVDVYKIMITCHQDQMSRRLHRHAIFCVLTEALNYVRTSNVLQDSITLSGQRVLLDTDLSSSDSEIHHFIHSGSHSCVRTRTFGQHAKAYRASLSISVALTENRASI